MKNLRKIIYLFFVCVLCLSFSEKKNSGQLKLCFQNYVGVSLLNLDSTSYKNSLGQEFTISTFKYYISNIRLVKENGTEVKLPNTYFLINEDKKNSLNFTIDNVPFNMYKAISFLIGVDSLRNCDGIQSGALDPINGMFWEWNTGYIFMKLEGSSSVSTSPGNFIEFHIGGYKHPNNCIRKITLPFQNQQISADSAQLLLNINTDLLKVFQSSMVIDFSKTSVVTDFHNATTVADNYINMFSLTNAKAISTK